MNVVESVRRSRVTGSLVGSDGSASMHGEHVELYSEEESSTGEEEEEEEEEEEVVVETYDIPESIENRPPTGGKVSSSMRRKKRRYNTQCLGKVSSHEGGKKVKARY